MTRIVRTREAARARPPSSSRRGLAGQRRRRRREREVKRAAVAYMRCSRRQGRGPTAAAEQIGLCARSLKRWEKAWHERRLEIRLRGRPPSTAGAELRAAVFATLEVLGPGIGVPTLRGLFPEVGKRELGELVRRYRHAHRRGRRISIHALRWTRAGSVWAMDFTEPPATVNGVYDQVLCVQDLGSECQLWSLPTIGKDEATVVGSLEALVRWYGAPLVVKLDNDGVFRAAAVRAWAERHGVLLLYSPPYRPAYNGSVECGIGELKVRAHYASALRDRPGVWTCDDVETARLQMNALRRPHGPAGPSPNDLWRDRTPIGENERRDLRKMHRCCYVVECVQRGLPWGVQLQHEERSSVDRAAIARALVKQGFLLIRRRRITLSVRRWRTDEIS